LPEWHYFLPVITLIAERQKDKLLDSFLSFQIVLDNSCHFRQRACNISALASLKRQMLTAAHFGAAQLQFPCPAALKLHEKA
jgi:hypothetical protein